MFMKIEKFLIVGIFAFLFISCSSNDKDEEVLDGPAITHEIYLKDNGVLSKADGGSISIPKGAKSVTLEFVSKGIDESHAFDNTAGVEVEFLSEYIERWKDIPDGAIVYDEIEEKDHSGKTILTPRYLQSVRVVVSDDKQAQSVTLRLVSNSGECDLDAATFTVNYVP